MAAVSKAITAIQRAREQQRRADAEDLYRAVHAAREASVVLIESALTTAFIAGLNAATVHNLHPKPRPRKRKR